MSLWLRAEAFHSIRGEAIPVQVEGRRLWVIPKIDPGRYAVMFRDPVARPPIYLLDPYDDYTGEVVDLGDGQFGACYWHIKYRPSYSRDYSPENATTVKLRNLAIGAVRAVIETGHPSPLEKGHFEDFFATGTLYNNLSLLGVMDDFRKVQRSFRGLRLSELGGPVGAPMIGPPTFEETNPSDDERESHRAATIRSRLERRYGLPLAELDHNYFTIRNKRFDLSDSVDIMVMFLGMTRPEDNRTFQADIRVIHSMLAEDVASPAHLENFIDKERARALRLEYRRVTKAISSVSKGRHSSVSSR